jgi:hypothetical protein
MLWIVCYRTVGYGFFNDGMTGALERFERLLFPKAEKALPAV